MKFSRWIKTCSFATVLALSAFMMALAHPLEGQGIPVQHRWSVSVSPLSLIDFVNGSKAAAGIDVLLSQKIASYTEFGAYMPYKFVTDDTKGFCIKQEFKYLWPMDSSNAQVFTSIELFHSHLTCLRTDIFDSTGQYEFYGKNGYERTYFEKHSYTGFTLNAGGRITLSPRWYIDLGAGAGLRINRLTPSLTNEEADYRYFGDWTVPDNYTQARGRHLIPKMSILLKLGYRFH